MKKIIYAFFLFLIMSTHIIASTNTTRNFTRIEINFRPIAKSPNTKPRTPTPYIEGYLENNIVNLYIRNYNGDAIFQLYDEDLELITSEVITTEENTMHSIQIASLPGQYVINVILQDAEYEGVIDIEE